MKKPIATEEQAERLRTLIERTFATRGRFPRLASATGISEDKWHNFWYRKQRATTDMLDAWCRAFPEDREYLTEGPQSETSLGFPFGAPRPFKSEMTTIRDRLRWVIAEWAAPVGDDRLRYLEQVSNLAGHSIKKSEWDDVLLGLQPASAAMVAVVDTKRPHFTRWILAGHVPPGDEFSVDPTESLSIRLYHARLHEDWDAVESIKKEQIKEIERELTGRSHKPARD